MSTSNIPVAVRQRARLLATYALRRGELTKEPCSRCGAKRSEMHHVDYYDPLNVIWVCRKHHMMLHRTRPRQRKRKKPFDWKAWCEWGT